MMSMFDEGADELVFAIPKVIVTNTDLFRSLRNQSANMMIQLEKKTSG